MTDGRRGGRAAARAEQCRTTGACGRSSARSSAAGRSTEVHELTKIDPLVPDPVPADRRAAARRRRWSACAASRATCCARSSAPASATRARVACSAPTRTPCATTRLEAGLKPAYKRIDTCAAEFESFTPYLYGTYEKECEADPTPRQKVVILGSGPNRIGQGIEFDYCCCHAAFALRDEGFETVMINCNPETVSTDYDTVDRLYFEPLTFEDVSAIIAREQEGGGDVACVVQYGGQTPLKLALPLQDAGDQDPRHLARFDRSRRGSRALRASCCGISAFRRRRAAPRRRPRKRARWRAKIGFPLVVRPSYVLGGRAMAIVYDMARARPLHDDRRRGVARASDPDRQVPRGRRRARRRRGRRRDRRGRHRRHHGAHRGGRHPLRRQLLRRAAVPGHRAARRR